MTRKRFHSLKRAKLRQTWNKINLYNISQMRSQDISNRTHFQQKWTAKSSTRAYHGEQIREKQWERMFRSGLRGVIPMDHKYLAQFDGSELAEGRGSGKEVSPDTPNDSSTRRQKRRVPYMNMTFAPTERRLDTAVFRALFASSARQARQFVVHGKVKVNGKQLFYPGYLLNPGDMFQVEPESVLFATGAPKISDQAKEGRGLRKWSQNPATRQPPKEAEEAESDAVEAKEEISAPEPPPSDESPAAKEVRKQRKADFVTLLDRAQSILEDRKHVPSAKRKQEVRSVVKAARKAMNQMNSKPVSEIYEEAAKLFQKLEISEPLKPETPKQTTPSVQELSKQQSRDLKEALRRARENPIDASKPYATPWQPRDFMSAFAFIPRYLEVNHNICSAIYIRHPVARPGLAEVPSPFAPETQQLAYNWYLRRR